MIPNDAYIGYQRRVLADFKSCVRMGDLSNDKRSREKLKFFFRGYEVSQL